jgi:hypothetical protein
MTEEDPGSGHLVALEADDGDLLWNTRIGNISNARQIYLVDGRQHVLVAAGQQLFAFLMCRRYRSTPVTDISLRCRIGLRRLPTTVCCGWHWG